MEQVEHTGVDELVLLVAGIVVHLHFIQHLPVLPPRGAHGRVTAAESGAVESDIGAPQSYDCPGVTTDLGLREVI